MRSWLSLLVGQSVLLFLLYHTGQNYQAGHARAIGEGCYPALLADIYIIAVSRVPFRLTEDHIEHNGATYHFSIIDLSSIAPSKQSFQLKYSTSPSR